jgi:hypothetical protein
MKPERQINYKNQKINHKQITIAKFKTLNFFIVKKEVPVINI